MNTVGLFGKIPAKADFIRHGVSEPAARAFHDWLHQGMESLRGAGLESPNHIVRFLFSPHGSGQVLVGLLVPSRDQVGRRFPLAAFYSMDAAWFAHRFSRVPIACYPFLEGLRGLLTRAQDLSFEELVAELAVVGTPTQEQFNTADGICDRTMNGLKAADFLSGSFDVAGREHHYALNTFLLACRNVSAAPPEHTGIIIDCPLSADVDLFAWLELASRSLAWTTEPPSFFWVEAPTPRMMIALGPTHTQMLRWFADDGSVHDRLWPLKTEHMSARDSATQALGATLHPFEPGSGASLGELLDALGGPVR